MEIEVSQGVSDFLNQLNRANTKLPTYISSGTITPDPAKVAAAIADEVRLRWVENADQQMHEQAEAWAAYKKGLFKGTIDDLPLGEPPLPLTLTPAPAAVPAKVFQRTSKFYQYLSKLDGFTRTIGEDLGIIKPETEVNYDEVIPILKVKVATGGHPLLHVAKKGFDGYQILKAVKGPGNHFTKLDTSYRADYLDTTELPTTNSQVWIYRVQYVEKGELVGQVSAAIEVAVFGYDLILTQ